MSFLMIAASAINLAVAPVLLPEVSTPVEKAAAAELYTAMAKMGADADFKVFIRSDATLGVDGIRIEPTAEGLVLAGHPARGPVYAVDVYLEKFCGVRWWTRDEAYYPRLAKLPMPEKAYSHEPKFKFRETFYRGPMTDADYKVRMKSNCSSYTRYILPPAKEASIPAEKGGNHKLVFFPARRSAYHSFFMIIPPAEYFKDHPEWFSLVKGVRTGSRDNFNWSKCKGQLCLTNEEMLREFVKNSKRFLRENPDCDSIQVTQNDWNHGVCECEKCKAFYDREGAVSGLYVDFANRVAAELEKEFPDVFVDTFAYQFTRKAPKTVRPRKNVLVRLCDIECDFNWPLKSCKGRNAAFMKDLEDWSKVAAGNLYIWDYQADFSSYVLPHPNLHVFADNVRTFVDAGAVGIFEQGDAMCDVGDFCALKQYLTAHLVWDPSLDERALAKEFCEGYYGPAAAGHLLKALDLGSAAVTAEGAKGMRCYHEKVDDWFDAEKANAVWAEIAAAKDAAKAAGEPYATRVRKAALSWEHARIIHWSDWKLDGDRKAAVADWVAAIRGFGINSYRETISPRLLEDYLRKLEGGDVAK